MTRQGARCLVNRHGTVLASALPPGTVPVLGPSTVNKNYPEVASEDSQGSALPDCTRHCGGTSDRGRVSRSIYTDSPWCTDATARRNTLATERPDPTARGVQ